MKRKLVRCLMLFVLPLAIYATVGNDGKDGRKKARKMERVLESMSDSDYENVRKEDLLRDEVYIKLARDGWSSHEIMRIMDDYIKENRKTVRGSFEYGMYAKQWLPVFGHVPGNDSIYRYVEPELNEEAIAGVRSLMARSGTQYYAPVPYTPDERLQGRRTPGYFRPVEQKPYTGRIHWIVVNPADKDALMVVPDGAGIFRTSDLGKTWDCVTDRIPDREFRKICSHSAIPVDPDDWNHFFAFMKNGNSTAVYETLDGGKSWTRIENATHKNFKRGYAFRDKEGNLKFIGAVQSGNYMYNTLWISEDKGVTWNQVTIPDDLKETHPENGNKGAFLQNFVFNPLNRDKIYFTGSRSIYYFEDGARATVVDGRKQYNVRKLVFNVYGPDGTTLRSENTTEFPYGSTSQGFLEINPNDTLQMWFASASRNVSYGVYSAVYRSDDGGKNWITLQEPKNGYGSGLAFGNESPWGWLGGFGVNFADTTRLYGCSMSSAKSFDGGRTFKEFGWPVRLKAEIDGSFYYTTSSRHNADNHCIVSHPSGRVFRGSDSGLLMIDPEINGHEWTSIDGNMGNQLHYSIKVNEFGDQLMLGNTQDVDVQTYRNGRWGHWRGYEGTEAFINPYSQTCYFSGGGGGGGLNGVSLGSWYEGYTYPDVFTGNWYLIHNPNDAGKSFFRIEDFGTETVNLSENVKDDSGKGTGVKDLFISRNGDHAVIVALNLNNTLVKSEDGGNTFTTVKVNNGVSATYSNTQLAGDPSQSDFVYLAQNGPKLYRIYINEVKNAEVMTVTGLPSGIDCTDLLYHEGSGDMYWFSKNYGLYRLANGADSWTLWMDGYNPLQMGRAVINNTTQEMVIADYGRGVWVADLAVPSDRYFSNGFRLKEISNVAGRRTLGIDTKWTIPQYYNYAWYVNDEEVMNPYQYLSSSSLKEGDKVKLILTLRESPDVSTVSEVYTVSGSSEILAYDKVPGSALYSDGSGRIDLGYTDCFFNDFTIELWVKPESDGVLLANRPVEVPKDTRGWALMVDGGKLKFRYAPENKFDQPTYEVSEIQEVDLTGPSVTMGRWMHVAVSQDRDGMISMYVNGDNVASGTRIKPSFTLNSSMYLSLFADGFENKAIKATVDELKIWDYALDENDVRKVMFSHSASDREGLAAYWSFNSDSLELEHELYSRSGMKPRTKAVTKYGFMPVPVAAVRADVRTLSGKTRFADGEVLIMNITPSANIGAEVGAYEYSAGISAIPGIDERYYNVMSAPYQIRTFGQLDGTETFDVEFNVTPSAGKQYQLYKCELTDDSKHWIKVSNLDVSESNTLVAVGVNALMLNDKALIILENKAAIEPLVINNGNSNEFTVYDDSRLDIDIEAHIVGGMDQPVGMFEIKSSTGLLGINDGLKFEGGKACTKLTVNVDSVKGKEYVTDTIVGVTSDRLIPLVVMVRNKMLSRDIGHSSTVASGALQMTDASVYGKLNGSNTVTMMGWVRIDSENVLQGVKPLIFFRGNNTSPCGIHLTDGNLRCHWNDGMYNLATPLTLTKADLGRWTHVALVVRPNRLELYMDGQIAYFTRTLAGAKIGSMLMLGQNSSGDKWFSGAFDQVSLWNRSLSEDEVRYYMQNSPKLNDDGLVCYIDMDHLDGDSRIQEVVGGSSLVTLGTVTAGTASNAPYNPKSTLLQAASDTENGQNVFVAMPAGKAIRCAISEFEGPSFNYVSQEHPEYRPLVNEHYTLLYESKPAFVSTETVTVVFNKPQVKVGENVVLALRKIGSENEFETFVNASETGDGRAVFKLAGDLINYPKEMMLLTDVTGGNDVEVRLLPVDVEQNDTIVLDAITTDVMLKAQVIRNFEDADVTLVATEEYASVEDNQLAHGVSEQTFRIRINKDGLNKLGVNPVTVKLNGVTVPAEFKFNIVLEPIVNIELAEADDDNRILVNTPLASFAVRARIVQGIMPDNLRIETSSGNAVSMTDLGLGSALANTDVVIGENLEFYDGENATDEGWNLVGNPYLSNVNFTKEQNIVVDESHILKYLYQYNAENDTYTVWDMVDNYDPSHRLAPFQPFFVQTTQQGARLVVKPQSKSLNLNRRVLNHYQEVESRIARIGLYHESSSVQADRTEIKLQRESDAGFVLGEDALKMWGGMNSKSNEIATYTDGKFMSVNVFPDEGLTIPVYLRLNATGSFRLALDYAAGFGEGDRVILADRITGIEWNLLDGNGYDFKVEKVEDATQRFLLRIKTETPVSVDDGNMSENVNVYAEDNVCVVENIPEGSLVEIFDVAGRRVVYHRSEADRYTVRLERGNYIVNIKEANNDYTTKINIR